jgi:predicted MFS family arabinose efflux permease
VTVWSLLTAVSGLAGGFWSLFLARLGVGVGEASCAPTANSLLGDLFPRERRARAISLFMLGLPLGLGLSFIVSGLVSDRWGWRAAFYVAAVPGFVLGLLSLAIAEPPRGAAEDRAVGASRRRGSPILLVLRIPTMWWIILSGALHNFNMYAIGSFLSPFLQRYHGLSTGNAGLINGVVYGIFGGCGIFLGGWACDWIVKRRVSGRLEVSTLAAALAGPCIWLALSEPPGSVWAFAAWMLPGSMLLYVYYSGVYAAIQDIVEPALRGTAMSVYFFAMYLLGAAIGPVITGQLSDYFAQQARIAGGNLPANVAILAASSQTVAPGHIPWAAMALSLEKERHAKAVGLHEAMYIIPLLSIALVVVLFAASRTVTKDHRRLQEWMAAGNPPG